MDELQEKRKRIRELMRYAVPDNCIAQANDLLVVFRDDRLALTVLDEFYRCLPEAQDDWVKEVRLVGIANEHHVSTGMISSIGAIDLA